MNSEDLFLLATLRRHATFTAAAQALGVAHTTVSRRTKDLEAHFGARLVERVGDKLILTAEGEAAVEASDQIEETLAALERRVSGRDGRLTGQVSLTTVDVLAWHYMDRIARFSRAYPEIELSVTAEAAVKSLSRREAEIALRLTNAPEEYLFGEVIGRFDFAPYAAADVAAKSDDLSEAVWLDYASQECALRSEDWMKQHVPHVKARHYYATPLLMMRAVEAGIGVGLLPVQVAQQCPNLTRLRPDVAFHLDVWLLAPKELRHTARIRALFTCLAGR
jgi:DNA-binding transcriptional LysR family regulator